MKFDPDATITVRAPFRYRIRWVMVAYLFGFAFFLYSYRTSFNVAAVQMMPELHISQLQLGWLMTAYLLTYTVLQLPGGVFGQWLGARRGLIITGVACVASQLITPLAPLWLVGTGLAAALLLSRLLLGAAQAPIFPISTGVIETWFPVGRWGCPNGLQTAGLHLGSAAATPVIAFMMQAYGWKQALTWTSLPLLLLIAMWAWYGRDRPADHRSVSTGELAELGVAIDRPAAANINYRDLMRVLGNRDVLLLTLSYTIMNYVFYLIANWSFIYLVQARHLSVPDSGLLGSLPFIAAAIGSGAGGQLADGLALRFGARTGYRILPVTMLPLAGILLLVGVKVSSPLWAVAALSLAYGAIETTEGIYSAATTAVAREHTMAAWGVLGTGGNLARHHRHTDRRLAVGTRFLDRRVRDRRGSGRGQRHPLAWGRWQPRARRRQRRLPRTMSPHGDRHVHILIIGGGAIGTALAYHLARAGARDVLLVEKAQLTHGCTWHAAGLVGQLRGKKNLTRLMQNSVAVFDRLEAETGQADLLEESRQPAARRERGALERDPSLDERRRGASASNATRCRRRSAAIAFPISTPPASTAPPSFPATATSIPIR